MQPADRTSSHAGPRAMRLARVGHAVFAVTLIGLGILGLVQGDFTPTWSGVPKDFPAREVLAYLCAVVSLISGLGLLWPRTAAVASRVLLASFLAWLLLVRAYHLVSAPTALDSWFSCGETAVMAAGAWVLYAGLAGDRDGPRLRFATGDSGLRLARVLYGLALLPFGVGHLVNLKDTASLVPGWLPWPTGWAFLTGCAFLAAGVAVLLGLCARLAATLSALQMGLFTLLVWAPILVKGGNAFQWSELVDSWALTAAAWVVAESYRGMPWLAVGRRREGK